MGILDQVAAEAKAPRGVLDQVVQESELSVLDQVALETTKPMSMQDMVAESDRLAKTPPRERAQQARGQFITDLGYEHPTLEVATQQLATLDKRLRSEQVEQSASLAQHMLSDPQLKSYLDGLHEGNVGSYAQDAVRQMRAATEEPSEFEPPQSYKDQIVSDALMLIAHGRPSPPPGAAKRVFNTILSVPWAAIFESTASMAGGVLKIKGVPLAEQLDERIQSGKFRLQRMLGLDTDTKGMPEELAGMVGGVVPYMFLPAKWVTPLFASSSFEGGFAQAKASGAGDAEAWASGAANAGVALGTVKILQKIIKPLEGLAKGWRPVVKQSLIDSSFFALMNVSTTAAGQAIAAAVYDKEPSFWKSVQASAESGSYGAAAGLILGIGKSLLARGMGGPGAGFWHKVEGLDAAGDMRGVDAKAFAERAKLIDASPEARAYKEALYQVALRTPGATRKGVEATVGPWVTRQATLLELRDKLEPGTAIGSKMFVELMDKAQATEGKALAQEPSLGQVYYRGIASGRAPSHTWAAENRDVAEMYAGEGGKIEEVSPPPGAKLLQAKSAVDLYAKLFKWSREDVEWLATANATGGGEAYRGTLLAYLGLEEKETGDLYKDMATIDKAVVKELKRQGYDGAIMNYNFREDSKGNVVGGKEILLISKELFQEPGTGGLGPKARTVFKADTSTMQFFKTADVSSVVHELLHVWRVQVMTPDESTTLLKTIGAEKWDKPAEERAARLFERWVREGKTEGPLAPVLASLSSYMASVYKQAKDVPGTEGGVSPEVGKFFERFLTQTEQIPPIFSRGKSALPSTQQELNQRGRFDSLISDTMNPALEFMLRNYPALTEGATSIKFVSRRVISETPDVAEGASAMFNRKTGVVSIADDLPYSEQVEVLAHELMHNYQQKHKLETKLWREVSIKDQQTWKEFLSGLTAKEYESLPPERRPFKAGTIAKMRFEKEQTPAAAPKPEGEVRRTLTQLPSSPPHERPSFLHRVVKGLESLIDISATVRDQPAGQETRAGIIQASIRSAQLSSPHELRAEQTQKALTSDDIKWTQQDKNGFTNLRLAVEKGLVPPNERLKNYVSALTAVRTAIGSEFEAARFYREGPHGRTEPYTQPVGPRLPRLPTKDYVRIVSSPGTPEHAAYVELLASYPENGKVKDIERHLGKISEGLQRTGIGSLEHVREFEVAPDYMVFEGKRIEMQVTDTKTLMDHSLYREADAIAWYETFGQALVDTPDAVKAKALAAAVGVLRKSDLKSLRDRLVRAGAEPAELEGKNFSQLKLFAKSLDPKFKFGVSKDQAIEDIDTVSDISKLSPHQIKNLKRAVRRMGGVSDRLLETTEANPTVYKVKFADGKNGNASVVPSEKGELAKFPGTTVEGQATWTVRGTDGSKVGFATKSDGVEYIVDRLKGKKVSGQGKIGVGQFRDPVKLLAEIKVRVREINHDDLKRLQGEFVAQGGRESDFVRFVSIAQGRPYPGYTNEPNLLVRSARMVSAVIGSLQISQAAIPNVFQTLLLPGFVGEGRYARALLAYAKSPRGEYERGLALGAFRSSDVRPHFGPTLTIEKATELFTHYASRVTLLNNMTARNRTLSATSFRLLAEDWKANKISPSEMLVARHLDLTPAEIASVNSGKMTDFIYQKIIQRGVARTQYDTELRTNKGILQLHPILQHLFPYQSYAMGSMRSTVQMIRDLGDGVKLLRSGGNPKLFLIASQRVLHNLVLYAGSGIVMGMARDAFTQKPPLKDDETLLSLALDGLVETQFMGPATRMMLASNSSSTDIGKAGIMLIPKVKAALDVIALGYNMLPTETKFGREGKLGAGTQIAGAAQKNFGLYRTAARWFDNFAWPEESTWREGRRLSSQYEKAQGREVREIESQINPDYYNIRVAVRRGDVDGARAEAAAYYRSHKAGDFAATVRNLRASLMQGRPIHVAEKDLMPALMSMPQESRGRVFKADVKYRSLVDLIAPTGR